MSTSFVRKGLVLRDWEVGHIHQNGRTRLTIRRIEEAPVVKPPVVITRPDLLERMRKDAIKDEEGAPFLLKLREDLAP